MQAAELFADGMMVRKLPTLPLRSRVIHRSQYGLLEFPP
jgi:hypothetical protein